MEELPCAEPKKKRKPRSARQALKRETLRADLLVRDGPDCWFCGVRMGADCTIEHLVPKSNGGRDTLANYALAHRKCNNDAANLPLVEKIAMRARLRDTANA